MLDIDNMNYDPFQEEIDYGEEFKKFLNKKGNQIANHAVDTYLKSPLIWKATAYNKLVPATIRFASKSLLGDTRPITEKDMTKAELEALADSVQRSSDRLSPGGLAEKTNKWANDLLNSEYKQQANKNYAGVFDEFTNNAVSNKPLTLPEILELNSEVSRPGLLPIDYTQDINKVYDMYAGNTGEGFGSILKKLFTDKAYDTRHAIASADYKYNPNTKILNVKDTYDFLPIDYKTNQIYKKVHDAVRTRGKAYPVNIQLKR